LQFTRISSQTLYEALGSYALCVKKSLKQEYSDCFRYCQNTKLFSQKFTKKYVFWQYLNEHRRSCLYLPRLFLALWSLHSCKISSYSKKKRFQFSNCCPCTFYNLKAFDLKLSIQLWSKLFLIWHKIQKNWIQTSWDVILHNIFFYNYFIDKVFLIAPRQ
jgi:hypothetical protein